MHCRAKNKNLALFKKQQEARGRSAPSPDRATV